MHPYGQKIQIRTHLKSVSVKCKTLTGNMKTLTWYVLFLSQLYAHVSYGPMVVWLMAVEHKMDFGIKQRFTIIWRKAILKCR